MATLQANSFALLNDEDSGDVSKLLVPIVKAKTMDKQKKKAQNGRADNGIGRGGKGRGSMTSVNEVEKKVSCNGSRPIGQQSNNEQGGYKQGYRRFQNGHGDSNHAVRVDGYQRSYGGNWQGRGHGRGQYPSGQGRGRVNQVPVVKVDQDQLGINGTEAGSGGSEGKWSGISRNQSMYSNGYWNYGGERRHNGGGFRRSTSVSHSHSGHEVSNNGNKDHTANGENGCAGSEGNVPASSTEVAKDAEHEERKRQQEKAEREREEREKQRREEYEKEMKMMTLEQYEKILVEKRKALEALKSEERKVTLDKELKSMTVVRKNKEDYNVLIKPDSEKDKLKRGSSDKEEKGRKAVSINEFLNPTRGQFNRSVPRHSTVVENVAATPTIEDLGQFPVLGSSN